MRTTPFYIQASARASMTRMESFDSKDWLGVPVVALQEGVFHASNSEKPELALAEEFGRFPEAWNGRPVVFNHPEITAERSSANHPDNLQTNGLGAIFNTQVKDGALQLEAWIDYPKMQANLASDDTPELLNDLYQRLESKEDIEVSVGFYGHIEQTEGTYEGLEYSGIWRNLIPDHLAFLQQGKTGACSVEGGCGAFRQAEIFQLMSKDSTTGELSAANPVTSTSASDPVNTRQASCGCKNPEKEKEKKSFTQALAAFAKNFFKPVQAVAGHSTADLERGLQLAIDKTSERWAYVVAVYDDYFVYYDSDDHLVRRSYSFQDDGTIVLGTDSEEVRQRTDFVPLKVEGGSTSEANATLESHQEQETMDPKANNPESQAAASSAAEGTSNQPATPPPAQFSSAKDFVEKAAPQQYQGDLLDALNQLEEARNAHIEVVLACECNQFDKAELEAFSTKHLAKLASMAAKPVSESSSESDNGNANANSDNSGNRADFSARAGSNQPAVRQQSSNAAPEPPKVFAVN